MGGDLISLLLRRGSAGKGGRGRPVKNSMKLALCGVVAALSTVVLMLNGGGPRGHAWPCRALAGCLVIPVVVEAGPALGLWACTGCAACWGVFCWRRTGRRCLFYVVFFGLLPGAVRGAGADPQLGRCGTGRSCWCSTPPWGWRCCSRCTCWASPFESLRLSGPGGACGAAGGAGQRGVRGVRPGPGGARSSSTCTGSTPGWGGILRGQIGERHGTAAAVRRSFFAPWGGGFPCI